MWRWMTLIRWGCQKPVSAIPWICVRTSRGPVTLQPVIQHGVNVAVMKSHINASPWARRRKLTRPPSSVKTGLKPDHFQRLKQNAASRGALTRNYFALYLPHCSVTVKAKLQFKQQMADKQVSDSLLWLIIGKKNNSSYILKSIFYSHWQKKTARVENYLLHQCEPVKTALMCYCGCSLFTMFHKNKQPCLASDARRLKPLTGSASAHWNLGFIKMTFPL